MAKRKPPKTDSEPMLIDKRWAETCKYMRTSVLNTAEFRDVWLEWWDYRKEKGKSHALVSTTVRYQIHKLEKYGVDMAIEALLLSMEKGWEGFKKQWVINERESGQRTSVDSPQPHAAPGKYDQIPRRSAKDGS